jgi:antitoxin ParD1/3/4
MPKNTSFILNEHFSNFIEAQIASGRYGNASEVMRDALRLLEERQSNLEALRAALIEGEESGPGEPWDVDAFLADCRRSLA